MSERTAFKVAYSYYRYNDGSANNGDVSREHSCKTAEDAIRLAERINTAAVRYNLSCDDESVTEEQREDDQELMNDLIDGACGGYFYTGAKAYVDLIQRELLSAPSDSKASA